MENTLNRLQKCFLYKVGRVKKLILRVAFVEVGGSCEKVFFVLARISWQVFTLTGADICVREITSRERWFYLDLFNPVYNKQNEASVRHWQQQIGIGFFQEWWNIKRRHPVNFFYFLNGPNPTSFLFIFVLFSHRMDKYSTNLTIIESQKHWWHASESNPGRQDGRRRRIHWAMAAPQFWSKLWPLKMAKGFLPHCCTKWPNIEHLI